MRIVWSNTAETQMKRIENIDSWDVEEVIEETLDEPLDEGGFDFEEAYEGQEFHGMVKHEGYVIEYHVNRNHDTATIQNVMTKRTARKNLEMYPW